MALPNDMSLLLGASGNILNNTVLANYPGASSVSFNVDATNVWGAILQIWDIGGASVNSTTNGVFYQVFSTSDGTNFDTNTYYPYYTIPTVANSIQRQSFLLNTGKYQVQLTNTDPANAINVMATTGILV